MNGMVCSGGARGGQGGIAQKIVLLQFAPQLWVKSRKIYIFLYKMVKTGDFVRVLPPFPPNDTGAATDALKNNLLDLLKNY